MFHQCGGWATIVGVLLWLSTGMLKAQEIGKLDMAFAPAGSMAGMNGSVINITVPPPPKNPRVADKSFWRMVLFTAGSAVLDGETTERGLEHSGCREINPLLGSHPDRARFYFTVGATDAGLSYLSWQLKKHRHEKAWKLALLGAITVHLGGAANNLRY